MRLINALAALRLPLAVYNAPMAFKKHAGSDWSRLASSLTDRRNEIVEGLAELRPAWILALDPDPFDEAAIREVRTRSPQTRIGTWFIEDPTTEAGSWWTSIAPVVDVFFSMEGGPFLDAVRERGGNAHWLPMACDDSVFTAPPPHAPREGIHFVGVPRPSRVALFESWVQRGLPLKVHGPGWSEIASLANHAGIGEWVDDERAAELYRSALIVVDLYDDRPGGYVNPRTFSVMAAGALVLSEYRADMERLFEPGTIEICEATAMSERIEGLISNPGRTVERGLVAAQGVLARHTFRHRAAEIVQALLAASSRTS